MAALRRGIPGYANGTDSVPQSQMMPQTFQQLPPELQQRLQSFQTPQTPQAPPTSDQAWTAAHPIAQVVQGVGSGLNPFAASGTAGRDFTAAAQNPEASQATRAIANVLNSFSNERRVNVLGQAPTPVEKLINMFGGNQKSDADIAQRDFTSNVYRNDDLTRQYLMNTPNDLAIAERDPHGYARQVQDPGFRKIMQQVVAAHAQAVNGIRQPDGTVKTPDDPNGVVRLAGATGATVDQAHPFHEPHNYNDDELVRAISSMPKGVVNRILEAQFGRVPSVQEQITQATYAALQADYTGKQKAFNDALALKKPTGGLQKDRDDAYKALHDFTLEVSRGASLMPPG